MINKISENIKYITSTINPLSSDIAIINDKWLFDVGDNEDNNKYLVGKYNVIISHFHKDHMGNLDNININELYVSSYTFKHINKGIIVSSDIDIDNLHIFLIPSSHAKGSLGLVVDKEYAFIGDAIYGMEKDNNIVYNAQLLKEEIEVFKKLDAKYFLLSHEMDKIRTKEEVINLLNKIYDLRSKNNPYINVNYEMLEF